ncbi:MAG: D-glycero-beta-D-manno-heptose-7-phosphate kinase [Candidatus Krumholzibacteriota bacterium]|nr:D-glycero-beta-D-manno-heptose-7-phosphate kinase [Candidatus Krumholzibacteriota bacterium]
MKRRSARKICSAIRKSSVAVVGDLMLDRYFWGQVDRISPEAPVPVVNVEKTNIRPGGAANVAWNLISLECRPRLVCVLGRDHQAREIKDFFSAQGISGEYMVTDGKRLTTEKIRIVAHNQQVVRADFESVEEIQGRTLTRLRAAIEMALEGAGAVVVSDYGKGVVSAPVMDTLRELCRRRSIPLLVDPKEGHFSLYRGARILTPNLAEAGGFYHRKIRSPEDLERTGRSLLQDLEAEAVLITRGEEGMTLFEKGKKSHHFPTRASEVYDVTGAGDTVISVLAAGLASGAPLYESIELANAAAGLVVRELGTAAVSLKNLVDSFPL